MQFEPTAEQRLILEAATATNDNLLISARAGAAKTTTIELIAAALPTTSILCLAFNKKIADELRTRLPDNTTSATLNAIGHRAWRNYLGRAPKVDARKCYGLLRAELDALPPAERDEAGENFRDLLQAISKAKSEGYLPAKLHATVRPLIMDESFFDLLEFIPTHTERLLINNVVSKSFKLALTGEIDFDDQILCPSIMPVSFEPYDLTMIDEAQDLSAINHVMLQKIVKKRRLIAVGDPCQAIYGFRGASESSMKELRQRFDMRELFLTICFRSGQKIIEAARWRAPDMQWRPDAPLGTVTEYERWTGGDLRDGDAIICRNNAPLFRMAITLLRAGLHPELASGDIIRGLLAIMTRFGPKSLERELALQALDGWEAQQKTRAKNPSRISDQAACVRVFLEATDTLGAAMDFLRSISNRAGRIHLMTGHKSKGLEFDRVWFLDEHLLKPKGQDLNLRYVIQTRARDSLMYATSEGWAGAGTDNGA